MCTDVVSTQTDSVDGGGPEVLTADKLPDAADPAGSHFAFTGSSCWQMYQNRLEDLL